MNTNHPWYADGTRVYAQRNHQPHTRDPIVAAAATPDIARHIADAHNSIIALNQLPTRIVPTSRRIPA